MFRLLILLPFAPRLDSTHGGGRVIAQFLSEIAARHQVAVLCFREADGEGADPTFRDRCQLLEELVCPASRSVPRPRRYLQVAGSLARLRPLWVADWWSAPFAARVRTVAGEFRPDIIHAETHVMGQYLAGLPDGAPRLLVTHEPGTRAAPYIRDAPRVVARVLAGVESVSWRRYEERLYPRLDAIVALTQEDRARVRERAGATSVELIPPGTVIPKRPLDPLGTPPGCLLFVGNFIHPPNADAARRLVRSIFPAVRRRVPGARLLVVGDHPPGDLVDASGEGVTVTGRVPDVTPHLDQAALVVAPIHVGGGIRIKILEALASGKAVVATPLAIEGLALEDGVNVSIAADDRQMVGCIVDLLRDEEKRASLAARARAWAERHLGWEGAVEGYERLYLRLLEHASDRPIDRRAPRRTE